MSNTTNIIDIRSAPTVVPVVSPTGRVHNLRVYGKTPHSDFIEHAGEDHYNRPIFTVRGIYMRQGWALLEDMCSEVAGGDAMWQDYRRYLEDWLAGRTKSSFPAERLPAAVLERRGKTVKSSDPWAKRAMAGAGRARRADGGDALADLKHLEREHEAALRELKVQREAAAAAIRQRDELKAQVEQGPAPAADGAPPSSKPAKR